MILAVITARSGSKSIPHKNIRNLGGIPLIGWTASAVAKSKLIDKSILSTDSEEYFNITKLFNKNIVFYRRTPDLAEDVPSEMVLLDVVNKSKDFLDDDSIIVLIQPTTPFITAENIDDCIKKILDNPNVNSCISVKQMTEYPEWAISEKDDNSDVGVCIDRSGDTNVRQTLKKRWIPNGGIWIVRKSFFEKSKKIVDNTSTLIYKMPKMNSIDIDDEDDFIMCESLVHLGIFAKP